VFDRGPKEGKENDAEAKEEEESAKCYLMKILMGGKFNFG